MTPELVIAMGTAVAAVVGAAVGGKKGGETAMNGFKEEVRESFKSVNGKLDGLTKTDGAHEARLGSIERIVDRRIREEDVVLERREIA